MKNKIINIGLLAALSSIMLNGAIPKYSLSPCELPGDIKISIEMSKYRLPKHCNTNLAKIENILSEPEKKRQEFILKVNNIEYTNRKNWFISYKEIREQYLEYSEYIGIPDSVYQHYGSDQLNMFYRLVTAEAGGGDFESKCNVASVVWNRLESQKYPNDILSIIFETNGSHQFTPTYDGRIYTVDVTEEEILAVEYTYMFGSTAYDCVAFDRTNGGSWNKNNLKAVFTDSIGHTFYR